MSVPLILALFLGLFFQATHAADYGLTGCNSNPCNPSGSSQCIPLKDGLYACECNTGFYGKDCANSGSPISIPFSYAAVNDVPNAPNSICGYGGYAMDNSSPGSGIFCNDGGSPPCEVPFTDVNGYPGSMYSDILTCDCFEGFTLGDDIATDTNGQTYPWINSCNMTESCVTDTQCNFGTCITSDALSLYQDASFVAKVCQCDVGYTGRYCDIPLSLSSLVITVMGFDPAICPAVVDLADPSGMSGLLPGVDSCQCNYPYSGTVCRVNREACNTIASPCANGGTCSPRLDGTYRCTCPPHSSGTICEVYDYCHSSPCQNGGICSNNQTADTYQCACDPEQGWEGKNCNLPKGYNEVKAWFQTFTLAPGEPTYEFELIFANESSGLAASPPVEYYGDLLGNPSVTLEITEAGYIWVLIINNPSIVSANVSGIPTTLLNHLETLTLTGTGLHGVLPPVFSTLRSLTLSNCLITGNLPFAATLRSISVTNVPITGGLTYENLQELVLVDVALNVELGDSLTVTRKLVLRNAPYVTGYVGAQIWSSNNREIRVVNTGMVFTIPVLVCPDRLELSGSGISGVISNLEIIGAMREFIISGTNLTGEIATMFDGKRLSSRKIKITNNPGITGSIPVFESALVNFELDLRNNSLTGPFPSVLLSPSAGNGTVYVSGNLLDCPPPQYNHPSYGDNQDYAAYVAQCAVCDPDPCKNSGVCAPTLAGSYHCTCDPYLYWNGAHCNLFIFYQELKEWFQTITLTSGQPTFDFELIFADENSGLAASPPIVTYGDEVTSRFVSFSIHPNGFVRSLVLSNPSISFANISTFPQAVSFELTSLVLVGQGIHGTLAHLTVPSLRNLTVQNSSITGELPSTETLDYLTIIGAPITGSLFPIWQGEAVSIITIHLEDVGLEFALETIEAVSNSIKVINAPLITGYMNPGVWNAIEFIEISNTGVSFDISISGEYVIHPGKTIILNNNPGIYGTLPNFTFLDPDAPYHFDFRGNSITGDVSTGLLNSTASGSSLYLSGNPMQCPPAQYNLSNYGSDQDYATYLANCASCPLNNNQICNGHGSCNPTTSTCTCLDGFTGNACQIGACASSPCFNGGTCVDVSASNFYCSCVSPLEGSNCANTNNGNRLRRVMRVHVTTDGTDAALDQILSAPNTVPVCNISTPAIRIDCNSNYQVTYFSLTSQSLTTNATDIADEIYREVVPQPQNVYINGQLCVSTPSDRYVCSTYQPCSSGPCQNGGSCTQDPIYQSFNCSCTEGYSGSLCQNLCPDTPCLNGGTCTISPTGSSCSCEFPLTTANCANSFDGEWLRQLFRTQFTTDGTDPSLDAILSASNFVPVCGISTPSLIIECDESSYITSVTFQSPSLTADPATITDSFGTFTEKPLTTLINGYSCTWDDYNLVYNCEFLVPCSSSPCQNGGTCSQDTVYQTYTCTCTSNYLGTDCENFNYCAESPCLNGGTCINSPSTSSYNCSCPVGQLWTGADCAFSTDGYLVRAWLQTVTQASGQDDFNLPQAQLEETPLCNVIFGNPSLDSFFRIACDATGAVTELNLSIPSVDFADVSTLPTGLTSLRSLTLKGTGIQGSLPSGLSLNTLVLQSTSIVGTIPSYSPPGGLLRISIFTSPGITGWISDDSWNSLASNVGSLRIGGTSMSGTIPDQPYTFGLSNIYLDGTSITGTIPDRFGADTFAGSRVGELVLIGTGITGTLPPSLNTMTYRSSLIFFVKNNPGIGGQLPSFTGRNRINFDFRNNTFTGTIPSNLLTSLVSGSRLYLAGNNLDCPIANYGLSAYSTGNDYSTVATTCASCPTSSGLTCGGHGTCTTAAGACTCETNYNGTSCDAFWATCSTLSTPCANGGTCVDDLNSFHCICASGWDASTNCTTPASTPCDAAPCQNGGTCTVSGLGYTCTCTSGYIGTDCETTDYCSGNPCVNGGTCTNGPSGYTCVCAPGWDVATSCNLPLGQPCDSAPCQNGGTCLNNLGSYTCLCEEGFIGDDCESADPCLINPCANGGTCLAGPSGHTCKCTGDLDPATDCTTTLPVCNGNGVTLTDGGACSCFSGFVGDTCATNVLPEGTCGPLPTQPPFSIDSIFTIASWDMDRTRLTSNVFSTVLSVAQSDLRYLAELSFNQDDNVTSVCFFPRLLSTYLKGFDQNPICRDTHHVNITFQSLLNNCAFDTSASTDTFFIATGRIFLTVNDPIVFAPVKKRADLDSDLYRSVAGSYRLVFTLPKVVNVTLEPSDILVDVDDCASSPCVHGWCLDQVNDYQCNCDAGWEGKDCDVLIDYCALYSPCANGATCSPLVTDYTCTCPPGYEDKNCSTVTDQCIQHSSECLNGATCVSGINNFTCTCVFGYAGSYCEYEIDFCASNPCDPDHGLCIPYLGGFFCACEYGWEPPLCDYWIDTCENRGQPSCLNGANCTAYPGGHTCSCATGWTGSDCSIQIDYCSSDPCQNSGVCTNHVGYHTCDCSGTGYHGDNCEILTDLCGTDYDHTCQNGATCTPSPNAITCTCAQGFNNTLCQDDYQQCQQYQPCQNGGTCSNILNGYTCACDEVYWTGTQCETNNNQCLLLQPCQNNGICSPLLNDYSCDCTGTNYHGDNCEIMDDNCIGNLCQHGSVCVNGFLTYTCDCSAVSYEGTYCENLIDRCNPEPCQNGGTCTSIEFGYTCACPTGWEGDRCQTLTDNCPGNLCENGALCVNELNNYTCSCEPGWMGRYCEILVNNCDPNPCQNGATCTNGVNTYTCTCVEGTTGGDCGAYIDYCSSPTLNNCSVHSQCLSVPYGYTCLCDFGYNGTYCDTEINFCDPEPCNATYTTQCTSNLNFNHPFYQCTCVAGITGALCDEVIDQCASNPCSNGATCYMPGVNQHACTCAPGYEGTHCENITDQCASNPCQNGATCTMPGVYQHTCTCVPGYTGTHCEILIDNCDPQPCQNGGTCTNLVNAFTCDCPPGEYNGTTCQFDINTCRTEPCQHNSTCINGIDAYTCDCTGTYYIGTLCNQTIDYCSMEPGICLNGATCVNNLEGLVCSCATDYEGTYCETDLNQCRSSPCLNGATCNNFPNSYTCTCPHGYEGNNCEIEIDYCLPEPCANGGTCNGFLGGYTCTCAPGYNGTTCTTLINRCDPQPCQNGGTCNPIFNDYYCTCLDWFTGTNCEDRIDYCDGHICQNGASCVNGYYNYTCSCLSGTSGTYCDTVNINMMASLTYLKYDPVTDVATFHLQTLVDYPFTLIDPSIPTSPNPAFGISTSITDMSCATNALHCRQKSIFQISGIAAAEYCSYEDSFFVQWTYTCRPSVAGNLCSLDPSPSHVKMVNITLHIGDFCGDISINPHIQGSMAPFEDSSFSVPRSSYHEGDRIYVKTLFQSEVDLVSSDLVDITFSIVTPSGNYTAHPIFNGLTNGVRAEVYLNNSYELINPSTHRYSFIPTIGDTLSPSVLIERSWANNGYVIFGVKATYSLSYRTAGQRKRTVTTTEQFLLSFQAGVFVVESVVNGTTTAITSTTTQTATSTIHVTSTLPGPTPTTTQTGTIVPTEHSTDGSSMTILITVGVVGTVLPVCVFVCIGLIIRRRRRSDCNYDSYGY